MFFRYFSVVFWDLGRNTFVLVRNRVRVAVFRVFILMDYIFMVKRFGFWRKNIFGD